MIDPIYDLLVDVKALVGFIRYIMPIATLYHVLDYSPLRVVQSPLRWLLSIMPCAFSITAFATLDHAFYHSPLRLLHDRV